MRCICLFFLLLFCIGCYSDPYKDKSNVAIGRIEGTMFASRELVLRNTTHFKFTETKGHDKIEIYGSWKTNNDTLILYDIKSNEVYAKYKIKNTFGELIYNGKFFNDYLTKQMTLVLRHSSSLSLN